MKIRHKQSGVELEGSFCECSSGSLSSPAQYYFMANDGNSRYDCREWEEAKPAPRSTFKSRYDGAFWQDIIENMSDRLDRLEARQS